MQQLLNGCCLRAIDACISYKAESAVGQLLTVTTLAESMHNTIHLCIWIKCEILVVVEYSNTTQLSVLA